MARFAVFRRSGLPAACLLKLIQTSLPVAYSVVAGISGGTSPKRLKRLKRFQ